MTATRLCSKTACGRPAVATLTYVYRDSTCVVGPLAVYAEPHTYDLCGLHAERLTPPVGWDIVRLEVDLAPPAGSGADDDLLAVVDATREEPVRPAARRAPERRTAATEPGAEMHPGRRHLRVLRDEES